MSRPSPAYLRGVQAGIEKERKRIQMNADQLRQALTRQGDSVLAATIDLAIRQVITGEPTGTPPPDRTP